MIRRTTLALALSISAIVACGGSQPPPNPPPPSAPEGDASAPKEASSDAGAPATASTASGGGSTTDVKPSSAFDQLSQDKKVEVMATKVVPNVGKIFKEHDAAKFGKFGCATCHGPSRKQDPHEVLPKLTMSNGGYEKLMKTHPDMMKFMGEKVAPAMAAALGEKPFDPATKQGFGCGGCHKID